MALPSQYWINQGTITVVPRWIGFKTTWDVNFSKLPKSWHTSTSGYVKKEHIYAQIIRFSPGKLFVCRGPAVKEEPGANRKDVLEGCGAEGKLVFRENTIQLALSYLK